jgi:hypothetical protein
MIHLTPVAAVRAALIGALLIACTRESGRPGSQGGALTITTRQRADIRLVGQDTLSDSARIVRLIPESDGDAIGILFADPLRQVSAGLALTDHAHPTPQLLWPDLVTAAWWSAPHSIAFSTRTGKGVRAVVDVHRAAIEVIERATDSPPAPARQVQNAATLSRATAYIDSLYVQPTGQPQRSSLKYSVDRIIPSPGGRFAALYVVARDSAGRPMNPAWYAMDLPTGRIERIEQITGPTLELPVEAAGWGNEGHFLFAKGRSVWEAEVADGTA